MPFRPLAALTVCLIVAGCASAERLAQRDNDRCTARGYAPDSSDFKKCLVDMETERQMRIDRRHQEMVERSANPLPSNR
jgi:hypothetical protein